MTQTAPKPGLGKRWNGLLLFAVLLFYCFIALFLLSDLKIFLIFYNYFNQECAISKLPVSKKRMNSVRLFSSIQTWKFVFFHLSLCLFILYFISLLLTKRFS